ncbi:hypothetical protein BC332_26440 [Capsicum chinense]|nr:hypothetical protein BC332_26440 [Capsicum chinense]
MILLKQEHAKLADTSSKDVVRKSSSSDESELALAGAAVASADLASQISQMKSKEGLKKCTTCHKHVGLTRYLDVLTTQAENSHDLGKRLRSTNTGTDLKC